MPTALRALVLGGVRLEVDGRAVDIPRSRERQVLAALVAARGRPVSADRLVAEIWGQDAPERAFGALQVAVSRLRSLLEPGRPARTPPRWLLTGAAGYSLVLPGEAVDAWEFDDLVSRVLATPDPAARVALSDSAQALWGGEPFAGSESEATGHEADRLVERALVLSEVRAQALLDLGRAAEALDATGPLTAAMPYRERLWALHALGLYRSARQSDALDALRTLRRNLADDLGIDPTPEVTELEAAILNQDPAIGAPPPVTSWAAVGSASAGTASAEPEGHGRGPIMVGREGDLSRLRQLLTSATGSDRGACVIVSGEPGIGKTQLVRTFVADAGLLGARSLVGRSHADFAPALWPWLPVLRALWAALSDPDDEDALAPVLRDVPEALSEGPGGALRLYDATHRLLGRAGVLSPTVVVIEDLHWADVTSLRLISYLVGVGLPPGVLLVVTLRTGETASDDLVGTLAVLARSGAERLRLRGLSAADAALLLTRLVGADDEGLLAHLSERTGGNPFFVHEYARLLEGLPDLRAVDPERLTVPEGVRDVLRQRFARLPAGVLALLSVGAVAGPTIDPDLVAAVSGEGVADVLDALDLALASGLLESDGVGYAFGHTLVRETLLAEMTPARQVRLHERLAVELGRLPDAGPDLLAEIAFHSRLAAPLGPGAAQRAVDALNRAAGAAGGRQAFDDALTLWRQARDIADAAGMGVAVSVAILAGMARSLQRLGRAPEARALIVEAVRLAVADSAWELVPDATHVLNQAGVWAWREHGVKDEQFVDDLHAALGHVDDDGRARILAALQIEHYYAWEGELAAELGGQSLSIARRLGDPGLLQEVLLAGLVAGSGPGKAELRLELLRELRALPLGDELMTYCEFLSAVALYECARVDEADAAAARCAAGSAKVRHTGVEVPLAWFVLSRAVESQEPEAIDAARAVLRRQWEGRGFAGAGLDVFYRLRVPGVEAAGGGPSAAELEEQLRAGPPGLRAVVAYSLLDSGDPDAARAILGEPSPSGASDYSVLAERCLRVAVLARLGLTSRVAEELVPLQQYSGQVVTYGAVDHLGAVDYFLALGWSVLGELPSARDSCERAIGLLRRLGNLPWLERAERLAVELTPPAPSQASTLPAD